jgi:hypothetical protein
VFLNAAVPAGSELIGRASDWLLVVFTHEYTHIVHLDRSRGVPGVLRALFGRTPFAFPNLALPQWQIEGLATYAEGRLTGQGRLNAGDFREIEIVNAARHAPLALDEAGGGLVRWPDGHAAYAAGLGFHEYLADRFGVASLGSLATATAGRIPFFGAGAFRDVYGQSLGSLWRDYTTALVEAAEIPQFSVVHQLTHVGNVVSGPRFATPACSGCPGEVLYSAQTPDDFPALRAIGTDGTGDRRLTTRYLGSTIGVGADTIVFDQQEITRTVGLYSDLFALDRTTMTVRRLTDEARLQDPDLSPDGRSIAAVREHGGERDLVIVHLEDAARAASPISVGRVETILGQSDTQYSAPRWSPDGRLLAVEQHRPGRLPGIAIVDPAARTVTRTWADADARIVTPAWRPDGDAIVAAADFDHGPFDLYELRLDDTTARRLTRTTGALWPDVSSDGRTIVFAGYTGAGFDLFTTPYASLVDVLPRSLREPAAPATFGGDSAEALKNAEPYTPLRTLLPTSWSPLLLSDPEQTRVGAAVAGADVLGRHAYAADVTWAAGSTDAVREPERSLPDWDVAYAYTRWTPSLFGSASRETDFPSTIDPDARQRRVVGRTRTELQAGLLVPVTRARHRSELLTSLVRTQTTARFPTADRETTLVSTRLALAFDTTQQYGYSISRERGIDIGVTFEAAQRALGSVASATTATVDARLYVPGARLHHVLAMRVAAARSRGDEQGRQAFRLDGVAASPTVIDFGASALALFRGSVNGVVAGDGLVVGNIEYRFPIARIERGYGTWPLFLRTVHASVFADAGHVSGAFADPSWKQAAGGELGADAVGAFTLPFTATVGVAVGRDGSTWRGARAYVRLGASF